MNPTDREFEEFAESKWFNRLPSSVWHHNCVAAAMGLAGETGEVVDLIKKFTVHGKDFERTKLVEELGDVEFYLARLRTLYNLDRDEIITANRRKLDARYPK